MLTLKVRPTQPRENRAWPGFARLGGGSVSCIQGLKGKKTLSSIAEGQTLRKTALNALHRRLGAKMVDFGGWDMPVEYPSSGGLVKEHIAVRTGVGMFDVSHMGDILIRGPQALD